MISQNSGGEINMIIDEDNFGAEGDEATINTNEEGPGDITYIGLDIRNL
jgi:hypothetical protein